MESGKHHSLVKTIYNYVSNLDYVEEKLIESDIFEVNGQVTKMPEGFIPDLFYKYKNIVIIGEAKTDKDLEREHSYNQYRSYVNYLKVHLELGFDCVLILAVPWEASITAYRIIKKITEDNNIKIVIMNEMGVYKEYEKNSIKQ